MAPAAPRADEARPDRFWRTLRSWKLRPAAADAGQRRPRRRSGDLNKTGTEPGYKASVSAGAIRGVHCRSQALSVFCSRAVVELLPALYECRLLSLMVARVVLRRSAAAR